MAKRAEERRVEARSQLCAARARTRNDVGFFLQLWTARLGRLHDGSGRDPTITIPGSSSRSRATRDEQPAEAKEGGRRAHKRGGSAARSQRLNCMRAQMCSSSSRRPRGRIQKPWRGTRGSTRRWLALTQDLRSDCRRTRNGSRRRRPIIDPANQQAIDAARHGRLPMKVRRMGWTHDQGNRRAGAVPPPLVFENYWEARDHYMKQQEELVGEAVRRRRFGRVWTWRLNRYNAICVIQKLVDAD